MASSSRSRKCQITVYAKYPGGTNAESKWNRFKLLKSSNTGLWSCKKWTSGWDKTFSTMFSRSSTKSVKLLQVNITPLLLLSRGTSEKTKKRKYLLIKNLTTGRTLNYKEKNPTFCFYDDLEDGIFNTIYGVEDWKLRNKFQLITKSAQ